MLHQSSPQLEYSPIPASILIIDDNPVVTKALAAVMSHAGYECIVCHSGEEALDYAKSSTPAAAIVDIHLPDINGLVLSRTLRERFGAATPIIIVSGDTSMENIKSLPHAGATYFFSKPVNATDLIERLKQLIA